MFKDCDINGILLTVIVNQIVDIEATGLVAKKSAGNGTFDRLCADRLRPALGQVDTFVVFLKLEQSCACPLQHGLRKQHRLGAFGGTRGTRKRTALLKQQECGDATCEQYHQQGGDDGGASLLNAHYRPAASGKRRVYCSPDKSVIESSSAEGK